VIKRQGTGHTASFTVRKISDSIGVERVFPYYSPNIESIVLNKTGNVRQAKLFYQRKRSGRVRGSAKSAWLLEQPQGNYTFTNNV
jgi:large subunit ribosomal protein L19